MIGVGDEVVCIRAAGCDDNCDPQIRPVVGEVYTVSAIYHMFYGLGCRLEGLNPWPYKGYLMRVDDNSKLSDAELGWYFEKLQKLDTKGMVSVGHSQDNERTPEHA